MLHKPTIQCTTSKQQVIASVAFLKLARQDHQ